MRCLCLGEASLSQIVLFCSLCGPLREHCRNCSELFLDFHRAFAFCGETYAQMGNACTYWSLQVFRFRKNKSQHWEFSAFSFLLELSVPGMEAELLGRRRRVEMMVDGEKGLLNYSVASIIVEVQKTSYISLLSCRPVNLRFSVY